MPELNWFYVLAVALVVVAGISGYLGTQWSGDKRSERIESKIDALGTELKEAIQQPDSPEKIATIEGVNQEYEAIAEEYFKNRDILAEREKVRVAQEGGQDPESEMPAPAYLHSIASEAEQLAGAYNKAAGREVLEVSDEAERPRPLVRMEFEGGETWVIEPDTDGGQTRSLVFKRLVSSDGSANPETLVYTDDTIAFVVQGNEFFVSEDRNISSGVKANVTDQVTRRRQPVDQLEPRAKEVLQKIIEYQLLPKD